MKFCIEKVKVFSGLRHEKYTIRYQRFSLFSVSLKYETMLLDQDHNQRS